MKRHLLQMTAAPLDDGDKLYLLLELRNLLGNISIRLDQQAAHRL